MYKKFIAIFLSCVMLVSISPAVAAEDAPVKPTIEEILSEYHQKAFDAQRSGEVHTAAANSRQSGSDSKTLDEETVDTLNAAGYEAYNITTDNYEALQAMLKTDFTCMGLDPNSSYIIVISGEEDSSSSNPNSRLGNLPVYDFYDGGGSGFTYTYEGTTYTMRYVTITNATAGNNALYASDRAMLSDIDYFDTISDSVIDYTLSWATDKAVEKVVDGVSEEVVQLIPFVGEICTVISLLVDVADALTEDPIQPVDPGSWFLSAGTAWTQRYIQIRDAQSGYWHTVQRSSYATTDASMYGAHVYDPETNGSKQLGGILQRNTVYSLYYQSESVCKAKAVEAYLGNYICFDSTGDIEIYFFNPDDPNAENNKVLVFTHKENSAPLLPSIQET